MKRYKEEDDDWKYENEEQIKTNIEIKINEKKLNLIILINLKKKENIK